MTNHNAQIYQNIATRTAGDIYIGVVGPVRAGKSTFIKRFMETQVLPSIRAAVRATARYFLAFICIPLSLCCFSLYYII